MEIRLAAPGDIAGVLQLQSKYFIGNLAAEARTGGFVSAEFTSQQLEDIARGSAIGTQLIGNLKPLRRMSPSSSLWNSITLWDISVQQVASTIDGFLCSRLSCGAFQT